MRKSLTFIGSLWFGSGFFISGLSAASNKEETLVSFDYSLVLLGETARQYETDLIYDIRIPLPEEEFHELEARLDLPTRLSNYIGPKPIRFYSRRKGDGGNWRQLAEISPDLSISREFLICVVLTARGKPIGFAVPLPENMNTPGLAFTMNLSRERMAAKINGKTGYIEPGQFFESDLTEISNYKMRIELAVEEPDGWRKVASTATTATPNSRLLFLHYVSPSSGEWVQKKLGLPEQVLFTESPSVSEASIGAD